MSDQDFFFDEDEQPKGASKPQKDSSSKASRSAAPAAAPAGQTVTMAVAALIGVIGLLAGLIIGILIPVGGSTAATPTVGGTGAPAQTAPQLSEEQMTGELPEGHPDIGSMGGGSGEATAPAETPGQ